MTEIKYWFKNKEFGYGWTPATREGWLVLLGFVVFITINNFGLSFRLEANTNNFISVVI